MIIPQNSALAGIGKMYRLFDATYRRRFNGLVFLTFLGSLADLIGLSFLIPLIGLVLSDSFYNKLLAHFPGLFDTGRETILLWASGVFFMIILVKNLFILWIYRLQTSFVKDFFIHSSFKMMERVYRRSLEEMDTKASYEWANKLTFQQGTLSNIVILPSLVIINEGLVIIFSTVLVCVWNYKLFLLLAAVLLPTVGVFYKRVKQVSRKASKEKNDTIVQMHHRAQDMIKGYTDIKIAGTERNFISRFMDRVRSFAILQEKTDFLVYVPGRIIEAGIFLCALIILLYSVLVLKDTESLVTTIGLFSVIAYRVTPSINRIVSAMGHIDSGMFILDDPDFKEEDSADETTVLPVTFDHTIQFNDVSFSYPGQQHLVLNHCSFTISKGDRVGIVGRSGSGKSTLIKHLLGYLQPHAGSIQIDGVPLKPKHLRGWWKLLGYVRQDVFIMDTTIAGNIALGEDRGDIDYPKLTRAIEAASLGEFVRAREGGVNSMITEAGNNLSGGQKQRIAIARALYKGAQILVFDEATSSLDAQTEAEINETIQQLKNTNITIIIIAHRQSSLQQCNKILELEAGAISNVYSYQQFADKY
jgi:ABC-type multidrug transport system fused ATPase/permease subunit